MSMLPPPLPGLPEANTYQLLAGAAGQQGGIVDVEVAAQHGGRPRVGRGTGHGRREGGGQGQQEGGEGGPSGARRTSCSDLPEEPAEASERQSPLGPWRRRHGPTRVARRSRLGNGCARGQGRTAPGHPMRSTACGGRLPPIRRRSSSRVCGVSTTCLRTDVASPAAVAVSRTRWEGLADLDLRRAAGHV